VKPVGPFLDRTSAERHAREDGWAVAEDAGRGWRRLVPSPAPIDVIEQAVIRSLLDQGVVVVAGGGGGIPVARAPDGTLTGCPAVVDKDATARLLALNLGAHTIIMSTGVDKVCLYFGTERERPLDRLTVADAKRYLADGQFPEGSMAPKIRAAINFLEGSGEQVIVTQPHHIRGALQGIYGTHITR
jgi:carbamate kinase